MATFVLIHGAWHGGWCWRAVEADLRSDGHEVLTPTLTGLGERAHLLTPAVDLATHVRDVTAVLEYEQVADAILVAHSYSALLAPAVVHAEPRRIRQVVVVDGFIAHAGEIPIVTGEQWSTSSEAVKKAYLVGLANMVQLQTAYQAGNPPSDAQSFLPRMAKGMEGQKLDSVREGVDRWYAANPTKMRHPVLDIIWFEMALPKLQKK